MLSPDVRKLLLDTDIGGGQPFFIIRRTMTREKGRMTESGKQRIKALGSVQPAGTDTLEQLPEADRTGEVLIIRTETKMQMGITNGTSDILSDEIEYRGGRYKILQLRDWGAWGIHTAFATKVGVVGE